MCYGYSKDCSFEYPKQICPCFCVELVKLTSSRALIYSVDIFSYSGPSGILGSDGKQNTA